LILMFLARNWLIITDVVNNTFNFLSVLKLKYHENPYCVLVLKILSILGF
jgi:hypothetical protein